MYGSGGGDESLAGHSVVFPSHGPRPCAEDHHAASQEAPWDTGHGKWYNNNNILGQFTLGHLIPNLAELVLW